MDANCKICLDLFSDNYNTVECKSDHGIHCNCYNSYLNANIFPNLHELRQVKCAIRCPVEDCGDFFDTMIAYSNMGKSQKCRYKSIVRFVSPEIRKIENLQSSILDSLTLRCPLCRTAVDPSPDACAAVMCLNCGKYYCNCCFLSFPNAVDGQDCAEAHIHTATHHVNKSAEERSSFLPEEVVREGQRMHQAKELMKYLSDTMLSDISDNFENREQVMNNITLGFILASDSLEDLDMNLLEVWKSALNIFHATFKQDVDKSGYELSLAATYIPPFAKPAESITLSCPAILKEELPSLFSGGTQLANAIKTGNDVAIGQILNTYDEETLDLDHIDPQEGSPLTALAISFVNNELALQLIQLGANPMTASRSGRTVLYMVIETGQANLLEAVANNSPNLNLALPLTCEDSGYKALHIAALFNHGHLIQRLLGLGAELDAKDEESENTPLILALLRNSEWAAQELIAAGADVTAETRNGRSSLYVAAEKGQSALLEMMLIGNEHLVDQEVTKDTKLTLMHVAASYCNSSVVSLLLRLHADPDVQEQEGGYTPLMMAIVNGSVSTTYELLQSGANCTKPARNGRTPMYFAVERGQAYVVEELVRRGISVNTPCTSEPSLARPLHVAMMYGQSHLIALLVRLGADIEPLDQDNGCTPLLIAAIYDDVMSVTALLRYGANPRTANAQGRNSIFIAAERGNAAILRLLLTVGRVPPHEPCTLWDSWGGPLHVAVQYNRPHIVWELLRLGVDPLMKDAYGRTAFDLANYMHAEECKQVLVG